MGDWYVGTGLKRIQTNLLLDQYAEPLVRRRVTQEVNLFQTCFVLLVIRAQLNNEYLVPFLTKFRK